MFLSKANVGPKAALAGQYQARLHAMEQLADAERDRAVRAEQHLGAEREHCHRLLTALTAMTGPEGRPGPAGAPAPAARRSGARATPVGATP